MKNGMELELERGKMDQNQLVVKVVRWEKLGVMMIWLGVVE